MMDYTAWEQSEINILKHYHPAAKTNDAIADILRIKVNNMEHAQWSQPSNTRAARIVDYDILILKLSKDTADNTGADDK